MSVIVEDTRSFGRSTMAVTDHFEHFANFDVDLSDNDRENIIPLYTELVGYYHQFRCVRPISDVQFIRVGCDGDIYVVVDVRGCSYYYTVDSYDTADGLLRVTVMAGVYDSDL